MAVSAVSNESDVFGKKKLTTGNNFWPTRRDRSTLADFTSLTKRT